VRIVIVGAGAIGGYVGARLCAAGANVALVARGPHLHAMQQRGLSIRSPAGDITVTPEATEDLASLGPADVVMLGVKAPGLTSIAPCLPPLLGPGTAVVSMQNGLPWWYFQQDDDAVDALRIERVDPGGIIAGAIDRRRVVGSIAYLSAEVEAPGVIRHTEGNRISFGEPDGTRSDRARRIAEALIAAGFRCPVTTRIRHEIWVKLLGNVAFNPVSALTRATLEQLARDPETARLVRQVMTEVEGIARSLGLILPVTVEQRFSGAGNVGAHKTSMLQDYEAGRPLELDAVVGAVVELADKLGIPIPATQAVYACTRMLEGRRDAAAGGQPPAR
jgi:2-dehydropantoate 2-reductase